MELDKMKKIFQKHPNLIYLIFFLGLLLMISIISTKIKDDIYFGNIAMSELWTSLSMRYQEWSSRVIIETILIFLLHLPHVVWMVLNSLMLTIIAWAISYLFTKHDYYTRIVSILAVSLVPLSTMTEAGWYATTLNYLWPLASLLISVIPIKHALEGKKESFWCYPIYMINAIIAGNQEQSCALLLGFYLLFSGYFFYKKQKAIFINLQTIIAICSMIFILSCPGNAIRSVKEALNWYPSFLQFSLFQKGLLGVNSTLAKLLINPQNVPFFTLSIMLILMMSKKEKYLRVISYIPFSLITYSSILHPYVSNLFPKLNVIYDTIVKFSQPISEVHLFSLRNWIICFLSLGMIISIMFCFYQFFKKEKEWRYFLPILLLAGFLSSVIMGFSSTVYASGMRTFTFLNYSFVILITIICCNLKNRQNSYLILILLSLLQIGSNFFI
jgi:hypothetical protein